MTRARADGVLVTAVTLAVLLGLIGCGAGGRAVEVVAGVGSGGAEVLSAEARAQGEAERARLATRLDALERRLVDGRARVRAWSALRERQRAAAVAARGEGGWRLAEVLQAREQERVLVRSIQAPRAGPAGLPDPAATAAP